MKIGIMSMQRIVNYGSFLQAYGLKRTIENLGHEVEFVDYKVEPSITGKKEKAKSSRLKRAVNMLRPKYRAWRSKQIKMNNTFSEFAEHFQKEYLPSLGVMDKLNLSPKIDTLVIGSDEVFNCTQEENMVGFSKQLFGQEQNADRIITYAASFGNTTYNKLCNYKVNTIIAEYLKSFDTISVRDNNSFEIIKELNLLEPKKHIDPVLLYPFEEVEKLKVSLKDYIVVYAYADRITEDETKVIRTFAKDAGKKIVSLGFYQPFCDEWIKANPFEVLAYIKNADYVITDTFHGAVFSIKYQKKFGVIIRESNKQKLTDLLKTFELEDHQIHSLAQLKDVLNRPLNTARTKQIISENQEKSIRYLKENL